MGDSTRVGVLKMSDADHVRTLTLNRPEVLNAFNGALFDAVADALESSETDESVACVLITGEGRAFSSGLDLRDDSPTEPGHGFERFIDRIESFPKPLVAAVNGVAVGVGVTMLPHCDIVLAAETARLRTPFVELGLTAEAASSVMLPRSIGIQNASYLLLAGPWVSGSQAADMGLVWRACPSEQLLNDALVLCRQIATLPLSSLMATKRLLVEGRIDVVRAARLRETAALTELATSYAHREAIEAFTSRAHRTLQPDT